MQETTQATPQEITGSVIVDGAPGPGVEVSLLDARGGVLAATRCDGGGAFRFPAEHRAAAGAVMAKLRAPVLGAVLSPVASGESGGQAPIVLRVDSARAHTLTLAVELPPQAAPVPWFDVSITPSALDGIAESAIAALTLDGAGPARQDAYHQVQVPVPRAQIRVLPGTFEVRVSHFTDGPKGALPSNWIGGRAVLADGAEVAAELGYLTLRVISDTDVRVVMQPYLAR